MQKCIFIPILYLISLLSCTATGTPPKHSQAAQRYAVPLAGNAFIIEGDNSDMINENGLVNWKSDKARVAVYVKIMSAGTINISLNSKIADGAATIKVEAGGSSHNITVRSREYAETEPLVISSISPGYLKIVLTGLKRTPQGFPDVKEILLSGSSLAVPPVYSNSADMYYWARRGPSDHIHYIVRAKNVSYFYNELTVPADMDQSGTYAMAAGFSHGYFGAQVNSDSERRILFSVWSPFKTDNPQQIPDDQRIKLIRKGNGVITNDFGNEGAGAQSYLHYAWKAGVAYGFLLKASPGENGSTDYTAWFHDSQANAWHFIATWRRPHTTSYLKGLYSFLENFQPEYGYRTRRANFNNAAYYDDQWHSVKHAVFTTDATYNKGQRVDAVGAADNSGFFLKIGGFFDDTVLPGTMLENKVAGKLPDIDFSQLP